MRDEKPDHETKAAIKSHICQSAPKQINNILLLDCLESHKEKQVTVETHDIAENSITFHCCDSSASDIRLIKYMTILSHHKTQIYGVFGPKL